MDSFSSVASCSSSSSRREGANDSNYSLPWNRLFCLLTMRPRWNWRQQCIEHWQQQKPTVVVANKRTFSLYNATHIHYCTIALHWLGWSNRCCSDFLRLWRSRLKCDSPSPPQGGTRGGTISLVSLNWKHNLLLLMLLSTFKGCILLSVLRRWLVGA